MERTNENINYQSIWEFLKKYKVPFILLFLIIITAYIHMQPYNLPNTDVMAENQITANIQGEIRNEILTQYPNLPQDQLENEVLKQYKQFLQTNDITPYVQQYSSQMKDYFQDVNGDTYLLAIDPYHYYQLADWQVRTGHQGDIIDGVVTNTLMRSGKNDVKVYWNLHSAIEAYSYKIGHFFNKDLTLMQTVFFIPILLMCLTAIVFYFIGNKIGGPIGGVVASLISTNHMSVVSRTVAGFSDTDPYYLLFPGIAILCFLYSFNFKGWKNISLLCLAGISISLLHIVWGGWWFILVFLLASAGLLIIVDLTTSIRTLFLLFSSTIISSVLFGKLAGYSWTYGLTDTIKSLYKLPLDFINIKSVATIDLWPNVMTTVAELNPSSLGNVLGAAGFNLFFFGMIGFFLSLVFVWFNRKDKTKLSINLVISGLLFVWVTSSIFASVTSVRFITLLVPGLALCFAYSLPKLYDLIVKKDVMPSWIIKVVGVGLICFITIPILSGGLNMAKQEFPGMNDNWHDSLTTINEDNVDGKGVIVSWWDMGHYFKVVANTSVVFDGGDQGRRIYWVGKLLLTDDFEQSKAIISMLDCGSDHTPNLLETYFNNTVKAVNVTETIIMQSELEARQTLLNEGLNEVQTQIIINETFCEHRKQYLILSEDMIGKAPVWAHFGSWDFNRANTYYNVKRLKYDKAIKYLKNEQNLTEAEASKIYYEIQTIPSDQWISSWPSYIQGWFPYNQSFADQQPVNVKMIHDVKNDRMRFSNPELQNSLFTKLYILDEQVEGFEPFIEATRPGIKVYKVNWE